MNNKTFQKTYDFYIHLYQTLYKIPKRDRFTWGQQTEMLAIEILGETARATYLPKGQKQTSLNLISTKIDLLKIFLRLGYDLRILDQKKYLARQGELQEIGRMVGGWLKRA